jgi:hypothetical protein
MNFTVTTRKMDRPDFEWSFSGRFFRMQNGSQTIRKPDDLSGFQTQNGCQSIRKPDQTFFNR